MTNIQGSVQACPPRHARGTHKPLSSAQSRAQECESPLLGNDHLFPASTGPRYRWRVADDRTKEKYQTPSTYVAHRPMTKLHRVAQSALRQVGLPTKHEGIHTLRRAAARHYYDSLAADPKRSHEGAI